MRLLIVSIVFILLTPSPLYAINCELIYDEFDHLMNGSFLQRPAKFTTVKQEQFSRDDYLNQTKQLQLYPNRKNHGVAVFRTNSNTRGKFLFTWQRKQASDKHPTLLIKELVTFGRVQDGFRKRVQRNISVASSFTLDLDTGRQGGGDRADIWFNNIDGKTMYIKATNGADIYFPTTSLCQAKPILRVASPQQVLAPATNLAVITPIPPSKGEKQVVKRELLNNGRILLTYSDGSQRELFNGGMANISPDGIRTEFLFNTAAPLDLPGEPPTSGEREWLELHRNNLLNIITTLVDNPEIVDEFVATVDNTNNVYESIQTRSRVIQQLIQN